MKIPENVPKSEDVIDRTKPQPLSEKVSEKTYDEKIALKQKWEDAKDDWKAMKQIEASKRNARKASGKR